MTTWTRHSWRIERTKRSATALAFGVYQGVNDCHADRLKACIKASHELGIVVVNEEARRHRAVVKRPAQRAGLRRHPNRVRMRRTARQMNLACP